MNNGKISKRQCLVLVFFALFGTANLFLPTELVRVGGRSGWSLLLPFGMVIFFVQGLFCHLNRKKPDFGVYEWYQYGFGKMIGTILSLVLLAYLVFVGGMEVRIFGEVVSATLLPKTPLWLLLAVFLVGTIFVASGGVEALGRMGEVLFFFVAIPLVLVLVALLFSVDFGRLLPISLPTKEVVFAATPYFAPLSQGLLLVPFFLFQTKWKKGQKMGVGGAVLFSLVVVLLMVVIAIATYGEDVLSEKMLPTLQMMERVGVANVFLNRRDLLFLWLWMVSTFLFLSMLLVFVIRLWSDILLVSGGKMSKWCCFWGLLFWVVANIPEDMWEAYAMRLIYLPVGNGIFLVAVPIILGLVDWVKGGKRHG